MADIASGDHDFLQVAALYRGRPDFDVAILVDELVGASRSRSCLSCGTSLQGSASGRSGNAPGTSSGSRTPGGHGQHTCTAQCTSADFLKQDYSRLRGRLCVPKERLISYPHLRTESDPSLVVGWAGGNHLQQASALVGYYDARKREGWEAKRLTPILAGLDQLLPWIHQWHPEIDPEFGDTAGQSYQSLLENDAHELGLTL